MKNIVIFTILLLVSFALQPQSATAQRANFDSDRMERDLRIMERIYTDLQRQAMGVVGVTNARSVSGGYFPGYGVIFTVNETLSSTFIVGNAVTVQTSSLRTAEDEFFRGQQSRSQTEVQFFAQGNRSSAAVDSVQEVKISMSPFSKVNTDSIRMAMTDINKAIIRDFFSNYADAIGQLQDTDHIAVVLSNRGSMLTYAFVGQNNRIQSSMQNPLRAEVLVGDVVAYRTGKISEDAFNKRIQFSELDPSSSNNKELQVMRGIFDSVLKNNKESRFSLTRDTQGVLMTNFGAMFNLDVSIPREVLWGSFNPSNISSVEVLNSDEGGETIIMLKDSTRIVLPASVGERQVSGAATVTSTGSRVPQGVVTMAEIPTDIRAQTLAGEYVSFRESMDKLIDQVSELLLDYGRTLRSLKADDKILVTIHQNTTRNDTEVPNRVEIQVDVKTLRDFDRGAMSRDEALKKLEVRRY